MRKLTDGRYCIFRTVETLYSDLTPFLFDLNDTDTGVQYPWFSFELDGDLLLNHGEIKGRSLYEEEKKLHLST